MRYLRCARWVGWNLLTVVNQWDAHLLTKQHRQAVARVKKEEEKDARKRERAAADEGKRKRVKVEEEAATPKEESTPTSNLPAGFFSAGGPSVGDEVDVEEEVEKPQEAPAPAPAPAPAETAGSGVDEDLDAFLSSLAEPDGASAPGEAAPTPAAPAAKKRSTYKDIPEGVASYSAAPVLTNGEAEEEEEPEAEETPAERRARLAREEREEIVQRMEDEQRAQ